MSLNRTFAISERIARQIIKDQRALALILVAPIIVMSLVGFSLSAQEDILNRIVPGLMGIFVLFFTFLLTGVSFLRERAQGTLERLQTTTVSRMDILVGYLVGFVFFAVIQSVIIVTYTVLVLPVTYQGEIWQIFSVLILLTIVIFADNLDFPAVVIYAGMNLGSVATVGVHCGRNPGGKCQECKHHHE